MLDAGDREFERLVDWVEGYLPEEEARTEERRVAADSTTQASAAWLQAFVLISENTVIASPPPEVRDTLIERFEAYADRKQGHGVLKRLIATLWYDSDLQPAAGMRAAGISEQREFVYCSEIADIAITVRSRPHDGHSEVEGQILPIDDTNPDAFGAQLLDGSTVAATTAANDLGEFSFGTVPPGTYNVLAISDQVEVRLTGVEVRRRR